MTKFAAVESSVIDKKCHPRMIRPVTVAIRNPMAFFMMYGSVINRAATNSRPLKAPHPGSKFTRIFEMAKWNRVTVPSHVARSKNAFHSDLCMRFEDTTSMKPRSVKIPKRYPKHRGIAASH